MRAFKRILVAAAFGLGMSSLAHADGVCYEPRTVPATWACQDNDGNSVDFTSGCQFVAQHVEQFEVACPGQWAGAMWSDTSSSETIRRMSCSGAGLGAPTSIGGMICKSSATPGGGGYVYTYKYTSGNTQDKAHQLFYCYRSRADAPSRSLEAPASGNKVTAYACAAQ